ncbi:MAG: DUF1192 domain-containing protein [Gemmatimonas sp.]
MDDDDLPRPVPGRLPARDLTPMGVAELESYIAELRAEIGRAEAAIRAKLGQRAGAESLFKK